MISQELIAKQRREGMRWNIINTLNKARPHTTSETFLLDIMNAIYPQTTATELRQQHFAEGKTDAEEGEKKSDQLPKFDVYKGFFHF